MSDVNPDGSVIVTEIVRDILVALANDMERTAAKVAEQVRHLDGDYLAAVESLGEEYAAQLLLLAGGSWGAGTR